MEKIKILITGSKGMLGSALVDRLSFEYEVKAIDIDNADITDKEKITRVVKEYSPAFIIHTAAFTDVDGCESDLDRAFAVNARGTENLTQASKEIDATIIYISTDYVFDGKKDTSYIETDIPNPINTYGKSKLEGERVIQALLRKYVILRSSWLFGPKGNNFVTTILEKAKKEDTLMVVCDQFGCPTYALDLADAICSLLSTLISQKSADLYGIYHLTNSDSCSWFDFAKEIITIKQLKTNLFPITTGQANRPAPRQKMSILNNSKAWNIFKLQLRPWQEALRDFLLKYT